MNIQDLISSFPDFECEVYYGGPVQTDTIHYLHTKGELLPDSIQVLSGVYWGGDFEDLKTYAAQGIIQPEDIRFFVGYTGWSSGQLQAEHSMASWLTAQGHREYVFGGGMHHLWKNVLEEQGGTYSIIGQIPTPILN